MSANLPTVMGADEARALTEEIRGAADRLWELLYRAWEGRAFEALGYQRWEDYVGTEFSFGKSHAYRLLDQGKVAHALREAAGLDPQSPIGDWSELATREVKPVLPALLDSVREKVADGVPPEQAVQEAVQEKREERRSAVQSAPPAGSQGIPAYRKPKPNQQQVLRFIRAAIDTADAARELTTQEIDAIPANDMMLAGLRRARDLADRIIQRHAQDAARASH
jgi:hypothetical protein